MLLPDELHHGPVVASWACGQRAPRAQIPVSTPASAIGARLPPGFSPDLQAQQGPDGTPCPSLKWLPLPGPRPGDGHPVPTWGSQQGPDSPPLPPLTFRWSRGSPPPHAVMLLPTSFAPPLPATALVRASVTSTPIASSLGSRFPFLTPTGCFSSAASRVFLDPLSGCVPPSLKMLQRRTAQ